MTAVADRHTALRRAGANAMRLSVADVERIAAKAEAWAREDHVRHLVARLDAVQPCACVHVRADWRECEPPPNRAGGV